MQQETETLQKANKTAKKISENTLTEWRSYIPVVDSKIKQWYSQNMS